MLISHVHIKVKTEFVDHFIAATIENAQNSILEPGIARFDVIQSDEAPGSFVLMEAYYSAEAQANHKETSHFKKWVETVEVMMSAPRYAVKFANVFPDDNRWGH